MLAEAAQAKKTPRGSRHDAAQTDRRGQPRLPAVERDRSDRRVRRGEAADGRAARPGLGIASGRCGEEANAHPRCTRQPAVFEALDQCRPVDHRADRHIQARRRQAAGREEPEMAPRRLREVPAVRPVENRGGRLRRGGNDSECTSTPPNNSRRCWRPSGRTGWAATGCARSG